MSFEIPFRFKHRASKETGFSPAATGICDGEFFIQQADKAIIFKDAQGNLTSICQINTGDFLFACQTGSFITSDQTGSFITADQTGAFGGGDGGQSFDTGILTGYLQRKVNGLVDDKNNFFLYDNATGNFICGGSSFNNNI
jgi:hypothetical protein